MKYAYEQATKPRKVLEGFGGKRREVKFIPIKEAYIIWFGTHQKYNSLDAAVVKHFVI